MRNSNGVPSHLAKPVTKSKHADDLAGEIP
jgi:hypothetical protein